MLLQYTSVCGERRIVQQQINKKAKTARGKIARDLLLLRNCSGSCFCSCSFYFFFSCQVQQQINKKAKTTRGKIARALLLLRN
jgi:hypothetical protein